MKLIYKTRNLALTALFGAALAMGTPAVMAQSIDDNVEPAPDPTQTGDYQEDMDNVLNYLSLIQAKDNQYQTEIPGIYNEVLKPEFEALYAKITTMLGDIAAANATAEKEGTAYVSPMNDGFVKDLIEGLAKICQEAVESQVAEASDKLNALGTALNEKAAELAAAYEDRIAEEFGEEDESFFLNVKAEDKLLEDIDAMHQQIAQASEAAAADSYESFVSPVTEEWVAEMEEQIQAYYDEGFYRIEKAQANLQAHDQNVEYYQQLEEAANEAVEAAVENAKAVLGDEIEWNDEEEEFFKDEPEFEKVRAAIQAFQDAYVEEAGKAQENNWQSYDYAPIVEMIPDVEKAIQDYTDDADFLVKKAQANIQLHDEDVETIANTETALAEAFDAVVANLKEKLGEDELTEEQEVFFTGEETYNKIAAEIDALRTLAVEAYDAAAADHWQSYQSNVLDSITGIDEQIGEYQDQTEYLANNAQAMHQQHDEDIDLIMRLEDELAQAAQAVADKYNSIIGEDVELPEEEIAAITNASTFDGIQALIDSLRNKVVAEAEKAEADNWQSYSQEATGVELAAQGIYEVILAYQEDATKHVEAVVDVINAHQQNIEVLMGLESKLMEGVQNAQDLYAEKLEPELGEADDAFFFDEEGFDAIQATIDNERNAVAQAYANAVASDYASYQSPITEQWIAQVEAQIQDYADEVEYRVLNAVAQLQLFEEDTELVQGLDTELFQAMVGAQNKIMELLGVDQLTDEQEEFFLDEKDYNAISAKIDALRQSVVAAYDAAAANNWQNYNQEASGVKENAQAIYEEILKYQDDTEYLANNAQAQMQLHDEDVELLETLDNELFNVVVAVQQKMQNQLAPEVEITDEMAEYFQYEKEFDAIQAQIDALRQSVVAAYDAAEADNWQNYNQEASGVKEHAQAIYEEILAYQDECEYRVNNAVANVQLHGEDADMIYDLESALQNVYDKLAAEAEGAIDAYILDGIRDYLFVAGYEDIVAQIEALRADMVAAYDAAAANNWQSYEQQVVPNASPVDEAIAEYDEVSSIRTLLAVENVEAHQYDLDLLLPLDEMLGDSVAELMEEKPELFEEGSEFVQKYEEYSAQVEALWNAIAQAATDAEENYWQTYEPVMDEEIAEALYSDIETFFAEAWGDAGNVNMNNWNKDNNSILALESMLMGAIETIQETNPEYDVDPEFDAIQAAIDNLRQEMAKAYEAAEATEWETYECPYTEADLQAVEDMIDEMVAHATGTSAIESVAGEEEQPMIFSIDGKRLNAPVKGELNIFVYKNRVEKKIVK